MQITLQVTPVEGEPYTVKTNLYAIVGLERKFKIRASDLVDGIALEHLAFLAYECSKHSGVAVSPVFDDFIKNVVAIDIVETEKPNPTEADLTDAH